MKTTGMIRRLDELGRIVIPKEIRRNLRLKEGSQFEIICDGNGDLILKKHSAVEKICTLAQEIVECIGKELNCSALMCDMQEFIACYGSLSMQYANLCISHFLDEQLRARREVVINGQDCKLAENILECNCSLTMPIIADSDVVGGIILLSKTKVVTSEEIKVMKIMARFIEKQIT